MNRNNRNYYTKTVFGLRQCLAAAETVKEINELLVIGTQFNYASPRTRRAWDRTAARRQAELATR